MLLPVRERRVHGTIQLHSIAPRDDLRRQEDSKEDP
jgi:hypothetical protein